VGYTPPPRPPRSIALGPIKPGDPEYRANQADPFIVCHCGMFNPIDLERCAYCDEPFLHQPPQNRLGPSQP
jgi:hypothetical protein